MLISITDWGRFLVHEFPADFAQVIVKAHIDRISEEPQSHTQEEH